MLYKGSVAPGNLVTFSGGVAYVTVSKGAAGLVFLPAQERTRQHAGGFSFVVKAALDGSAPA